MVADIEPDSAPSVERRSPDRPWLVAGWSIAAVLVLIPLVRMVQLILEGSALQHNDYWMMLPKFANPDGSLNVPGLFEFQNHPVVLPQLVYWLNIKLFDGSNIALGFFVVALTLATIGVLYLVVRRSAMRPWEQMVMVVLSSALLFSMVGSWNYVKAMSGTAWFFANVFAVTAVYLRSRDRVYAAFALGVLASVSYGTGIAVWAALIAAGVILRPPRSWWRELPFAAAFVATYLWYGSAGGETGKSPSLEDGFAAAANLIEQPLGLAGSSGATIGYAACAAMMGLAIFCAVKIRTPTAAAWTGVTAFGVVATLLLGYGRHEILQFFGEQSRYTSLPALAWIGFVGLIFTVVDWRRDRAEATATSGRRWAVAGTVLGVAVGVVIAVVATVSGGKTADAMRVTKDEQLLREISLRAGLYTDGSPYLVGPLVTEGIEPVDAILHSTSHYPFVDGWDLDCGLLGQPVPGVGDASPSTLPVTAKRTIWLHNTTEITGTLDVDGPIRCILVVGPDDVAIGAGIEVTPDPAERTPDGTRTFHGLAAADAGPFRVYALPSGDGEPVLIGTADKGA